MPKYNEPSVSSGSIGTARVKITGPSSSPSVGRKMLNPVSLRPRMIDQLMDDAPRWSGSRLGWNWIVPNLGMLQKSWGTNWVT